MTNSPSTDRLEERYGDAVLARRFHARKHGDRDDNPWLPIDTMPLSTVGTEVDIQDEKRLYSGVTVTGIRYEKDVIYERYMDGRETFNVGAIDDFTITTTTASIRVTTKAQWRPHV